MNATPPPAADSPPTLPQAVAVIETDSYCETCGYNLRTQPVWRDARLGVLVCRCPECNRHRAAGLAVVGSLWGRRAATALLAVWVLLCTAGVAIAVGFTLWLQTEAAGVLTYNELQTRDGTPVRSNYIHVGQPRAVYWTGETDVEFRPDGNGQIKAFLTSTRAEIDLNGPPFVPAADVVLRYRLPDWLTGPTASNGSSGPYGGRPSQPWEEAAIYLGVAGGLAFAFGLVMACVCWHWRRRRWTWTLLPVLALSLSLTLARPTSHGWQATPAVPADNARLVDGVILFVALWQATATALGLWLGRMIARTLVRLFVPARARTLLNFLWIADGKTPPRAVVEPANTA